MDATITLGAIASVTTISGFGLAIISLLRKNRREDEADRKAGNDDIKIEF